MAEHVTVSVADLEALMLAASCVTGVYNAVAAHKQDAAVNRTRDSVSFAISNANKAIAEARRVPDPLENEPPDALELEYMNRMQPGYIGDGNYPDPRSVVAVNLQRKRLAVMGHLTGTIHWGDKTTTVEKSDKILWKLTAKGERALDSLGMLLLPFVD